MLLRTTNLVVRIKAISIYIRIESVILYFKFEGILQIMSKDILLWDDIQILQNVKD